MSLKRSLFFSFFLVSVAYSSDVLEDLAVRRIHDHILIHDPESAVREGKYFFSKYPESLKIQEAYLEALCRKGEEIEAYRQYSLLFEKEKNEEQRRLISECLAWGVLDKGESSSLLLIRLYSLLGAAFTQDARALPILLKEMRGSNAFLRSLAIKLSINYGDGPLQEELIRLLKEEKVWFVRLEVIQAIGALKIKCARNALKDIIIQPKTLVEEKSAAIIALISMYESISKEELTQLLQSNRAGLRHLGSEIMAHLDFKEGAEDLVALLLDDSLDVRISAMNTLGLLRVKYIKDRSVFSLIQKNLENSNASISITAAWLATILGHEEGIRVLREWMQKDYPEARRLASAAITATGSFGVKLAEERIRQETDPYARVNLAIGLIGQRKEVELSSGILFQAFQESGNDLWMWDSESNPLFRSLSPSKIKHVDQVPRYPQVVDQLTKLEILSVLSIVKYPNALDAVKKFLKTQESGVTSAAAVTLLQEGDDSSLVLVRQLLEDSDEIIRIQAAFILALWGGDPSAIKVLVESYAGADRETKIHILEAIGHIGDPSTIPFLTDILKEPFQGLRVVAAAALIQCLYH